MHSSKNDGDALYWQHGVELRGVFDTQLAQVLLDKANGRRYPVKHKLADVVSLHCPDKAASVEQEKDVVQTKWIKLEGEYWGKRPLTDEMKEYAANDVLALIPEVYNEQKRLLQRLGRMETLKTTVEKEIRSKRDRALFDRIVQEEKETLKSVLTDFANSPSRPRKVEDITDEDVLGALGHLRLDELPTMGLPPLIKELKVQHMKSRLNEIEAELRDKGKNFEPSNSVCGFIRACVIACDDEGVKQHATGLQDRIDNIIIEDFKRKYTVNTPVTHIADYERKVIGRKLRPKVTTTSNYYYYYYHHYYYYYYYLRFGKALYPVSLTGSNRRELNPTRTLT
nr:hypothetical protein BaRGS_021509 [Batillaria attramentaria]